MRISKAAHTFLSAGAAAGAMACLMFAFYPQLGAWTLLFLVVYPILLWCAQILVDLGLSRPLSNVNGGSDGIPRDAPD